MPTAKPVNLQISDIIAWFRAKELVINTDFQRHSVWTPAGRTFLIDTILNELPIPKIYLRTKIDPHTQTSIREIVDGQQRVRAIVDFADSKLKLTNRSEKFHGKQYEDLTDEEKERFLGYIITAEQLLNATDDDVIDVFARLNSYTVALNPAEKRHAEFQTEFKFAVRQASQKWRGFIEKYNIFTTKQRFRMLDDTLFAEIFGVLLEGVKDGGEANIKRLYQRQTDDKFTESVAKSARRRLDAALTYLDLSLGDVLRGSLSRHYHILLLVAAYTHHRFGIPRGDIEDDLPRSKIASTDVILGRLGELESAIESQRSRGRYADFVKASAESTHRIVTRKVRFRVLVDIMACE